VRVGFLFTGRGGFYSEPRIVPDFDYGSHGRSCETGMPPCESANVKALEPLSIEGDRATVYNLRQGYEAR